MDSSDQNFMGSLTKGFDELGLRSSSLTSRRKQEKPLLKYSIASESGPIYLYQNPDLAKRTGGMIATSTMNKYNSPATTSNNIISSMNAASRPFSSSQYNFASSTDPYFSRPLSAKDLMTVGLERSKTTSNLSMANGNTMHASNAFFRTSKPAHLHSQMSADHLNTQANAGAALTDSRVISTDSTNAAQSAKMKFEASLTKPPIDPQRKGSRPPSAIRRPVSTRNIRNPNYRISEAPSLVDPNKPYGTRNNTDCEENDQGSVGSAKENLNTTIAHAINNLSHQTKTSTPSENSTHKPPLATKSSSASSLPSSESSSVTSSPARTRGVAGDRPQSGSLRNIRSNTSSASSSDADSSSTPYYFKSSKPEVRINPLKHDRSAGDGLAASSSAFETPPTSKSSGGDSAVSKLSTASSERAHSEEDDDNDDGDDDDSDLSERIPGDGECSDYEDEDDDMIDGLEDDDLEGPDDDDDSMSSRSPSSSARSARIRSASSSRRHHSLEPGQPLRMKSARWRSHSQYAEHSATQPALVKSLFRHVPPYLNFTTEHEKIELLPWEFRRLLKWRMCSITPNIVKNTIIRSGFRTTKKNHDWLGCWGKHMKAPGFKAIRDYQKLNHFPGSFQVGRKDRLWRNLSKMQIQFGKKEFNFFPTTYVVPQDLKALKRAWEDGGNRQKWIIKPPASARGIGIKVINKWNQIPKKRPIIVQKYLGRPLLINESKFDCRIYVYVTSYDPLRIYVYEDGLVRFCSQKYSNSMKHINNKYMHLTNYSIQKKNDEYESNADDTICQGHKWSLKALWGYLLKRGVNTNEIWKNIKDLIVKTIICAESPINSMIKANVRNRYSVHELFGFDVLLDEQYKPYVLEVNISPSLHSNSQLDINIKGGMVKDLHNLAGFRIPDKNDIIPNPSAENYKIGIPNNKYCMDKRVYPQALSADEKAKHAYYCQRHHDVHAMSTITDQLTPDDMRILIESIDEDSRKGGFQRVFPTPTTNKYLRYFESPRYYNLFLDHWCQKFNRVEAKGIALIEAACKLKIHLQNPTDDSRYQWCPPSNRISLSTSQISSSTTMTPRRKVTDIRSSTAVTTRPPLPNSNTRTLTAS